MKEFTRASGIVRIQLPDSAGDVTDTAAGGSSPRGAPGINAAENVRQVELGIMLAALSEQSSLSDKPLQLVNRFATDLGSGSSSAPRGGSPLALTEKQEMNIDLSLPDGESAVVLIEQDGRYEWHYPSRRKDIPPGTRGSRSAEETTSASVSQVSFTIPIGDDSELPPDSGTSRGHRGPVTNFIKGKITGIILKFVARKSIGALTRRLERGVRQGLVVVNSNDDATLWKHHANLPIETLSGKRGRRRILLLVHGTFSSTLGSFGALSTHAEGQAMLQGALEHYDLVVGHDHHTLSDTPENNAEAILDSLLPLIADGQTLEIDAISFSRGGLVFRYLSEVLIPDAGVPIVCGKAIFVACTNAGTELANDENWTRLVDCYTNMIAGATRLIGLAPGAALPSLILRQGIKAIGSMVSYIAQDGISNNAVPGVAAMEPMGDFVTAMNRLPTHRTLPAVQASYVIASNFEPDGSDAFGLAKTLGLKVADGFVDELMGLDNDLVVNNTSMFVIDPMPAATMTASRQLEANGRIFHTVYFHQPMVASTCSDWLGIAQPEARLPTAPAAEIPIS